MQALKKEVDAIAALLQQGAESPQELAKSVIKELDQARAERVTYSAIMRFDGPVFIGTGPYSTRAQAQKALEKHPAAGMVRGWAIVPEITGEGYAELLKSVDASAESRGDYAQVKLDAAAKRNGWDGKNATRGRYL